MARRFHFDGFTLDLTERRLLRGDTPLAVSPRYFDALAVLVTARGNLVTKDALFDAAWHGTPVTDEALTQCIRTLRRLLGDKATAPSFIETVPKHGYRFIAPITDPAPDGVAVAPPHRNAIVIGLAGALGGGLAGIIGGISYGSVGAAAIMGNGMGGSSALLVLTCITTLLGLVGGVGIGFGIAAAMMLPARRWWWHMAGGAAGGLVVGGFGKLLGMEAFRLLLGRSPGDITGAAEGALLGAAIGIAVWFVLEHPVRRIAAALAIAAVAGIGAGVAITLIRGKLMVGSLITLSRQFPDAPLHADAAWLSGSDATALPVANIVESALFACCLIAAMLFVRRYKCRDALDFIESDQ